MLLRFVYLDTLTLDDYAAQLDGGTLVETKTRRLKKRGGGVKAGAGSVSMNLDLASDGEEAETYSHPPAAQFQRLLSIAERESDALVWTEVLEPNSIFQELQAGETVMWECDVDIHQASRIMAKGGGGAKMLEVLPTLLSAASAKAATGDETVSPEVLQKIEQLAKLGTLGKRLIDDASLKPVVMCTDDETEWTVYGELDSDYLRVSDIKDERLMVVGKIKRVVSRGEWRRVITAPGFPMTTMLQNSPISGTGEPPTENLDPFVRGPALELDILAIYR